MDINSVTITARATKDTELKTTQYAIIDTAKGNKKAPLRATKPQQGDYYEYITKMQN